jgi:hypothetical protein
LLVVVEEDVLMEVVVEQVGLIMLQQQFQQELIL